MLHCPVRRFLYEGPVTGPSGAHCLVIDAIATLVHIKKSSMELVLRCVAVPAGYIRRVLAERDPGIGGRERATCH